MRYVEIAREDAVLRETDKAILVFFGDGETWFPKSQCKMDDQGVFGRFWYAPAWLIAKKGGGEHSYGREKVECNGAGLGV